MSFPTNATALDNFNRANGTPGANWSLAHAFVGTALFQIISNQAAPSNDYVIAYWNPSTYGPDSEAYGTMVVVETVNLDGPYMCLRLQQPGTGTLDGYCISCENSGVNIKLNRIDNGTLTALGASVSSSMSANDKFGIEALSSTLNAWVKHGTNAWTNVASRTDTTYASAGYLGMYLGADQATVRVDDFTGGVATAPSTSLTMPTIAKRSIHMLTR